MKKVSFFAVFAGIMVSLPMAAGAAYPVFNPQQLSNQGYVVNTQYMAQPTLTGQTTNITSQQLAAASAKNGRPMAATNPNRITGALPRVGSSATNAGRQYYQAADYDRLAESGLYIGLSAAYSTMIKGQMSADYASDPAGYLAPGSFRASDIQSDTVIPLQISVGAAINSDIRLDFSFLRYSGMSYASSVQTYTGLEDAPYADASVSGGAITSNSTMLNVYYNIDSFTGYMAGGALRPYVGAGVGLALNTIADYVVLDPGPYDDVDVNGLPVQIFDIEAYHNGGTMEQLAFNLEAGVTTDMKDGLKLDFFVRYANLGKVKTSGSVIIAQAEMGETGDIYDSTFHYINWFESGRLSSLDVGARVRLEF